MYSGGALGVSDDLDPKQTKKRNNVRKKMNKKGTQKDQPKEFIQLENAKKVKKHVVEQAVKEQLFSYIVEQGNPNQVMELYDNITKMLALSLQYTRMFMVDGMKLGTEKAVNFNYRRAKAELSHVSKMIKDIDQILVKVCHQYKQEQAQSDTPEETLQATPESPTAEDPKKEQYAEVKVIKEITTGSRVGLDMEKIKGQKEKLLILKLEKMIIETYFEAIARAASSKVTFKKME